MGTAIGTSQTRRKSVRRSNLVAFEGFIIVPQTPCRSDWRIFPVSGVVLQSRKTLGEHPINIECATQMIDLVLKYAGIPSGSINDPRFSAMIEAGYAHLLGSGNECRKTGQAQTTFKESRRGFGDQLNHGVHNHVKRDFASSSLFQFRLGESFVILGLIFNHGKLQ